MRVMSKRVISILSRLCIITFILTLFINIGTTYSDSAGNVEAVVTKLRQDKASIDAYKAVINELKAAVLDKFTDVKADKWYTDYVSILYGMGIITGNGSNQLKLDSELKVDEFIKMLITSIGKDNKGASAEYWAQGYIDEAKKMGIVLDGEFSKYNIPITRYEAARMIYRACKSEQKTDNEKVQIKDWNSIPENFGKSVLYVWSKGIINGYGDGSFEGNKHIRIDEAAAIIVRLLEKNDLKSDISDNKLGTIIVKYIFKDKVLKEIEKETKLYESITVSYESINSYVFKETVIDGQKASFEKHIVFTPTADKRNMEINFYCEKVKYDYVVNMHIKDNKGQWIDIDEKYLENNPMDYGYAAGKNNSFSKEFTAPGDKENDEIMIKDKSGYEYIYTGKYTAVRHEGEEEKSREFTGKRYTAVFSEKCKYIEIIYYYEKKSQYPKH